jgi:hypothetical protein
VDGPKGRQGPLGQGVDVSWALDTSVTTASTEAPSTRHQAPVSAMLRLHVIVIVPSYGVLDARVLSSIAWQDV